MDRSEDGQKICWRQRRPPPLLSALSRAAHSPSVASGYRALAAHLAADRRRLLRLVPAQRAVCIPDELQLDSGLAINGLVLARTRALRKTTFSPSAFAGKPNNTRTISTPSSH
ncbi:hypothetical protein GCM10020000_79700 [Streptomyces olivoverticillatus]